MKKVLHSLLIFIVTAFALGTTPTMVDWNTQVRNKPNVVTTDTVQTITAAKTFTSTVSITGNSAGVLETILQHGNGYGLSVTSDVATGAKAIYANVGISTLGVAITGNAASGTGVLGTSATNLGAGVEGDNTIGTGVEGTATSGTGGIFTATTGEGLYAASTSGYAAEFQNKVLFDAYAVFSTMPTSCSGLPTGTLRNNSGVVNVCP